MEIVVAVNTCKGGVRRNPWRGFWEKFSDYVGGRVFAVPSTAPRPLNSAHPTSPQMLFLLDSSAHMVSPYNVIHRHPKSLFARLQRHRKLVAAKCRAWAEMRSIAKNKLFCLRSEIASNRRVIYFWLFAMKNRKLEEWKARVPLDARKISQAINKSIATDNENPAQCHRTRLCRRWDKKRLPRDSTDNSSGKGE